MTMVGATQGADGFGLRRGGGWYRRRLERDLGMTGDPFARRGPGRQGRGANPHRTVAESPPLGRVTRSSAGKRVPFVGVAPSDPRRDAAAFLTKAGVTYPTVYDKNGLLGGVAAHWAVTALPQTWFVDRDGGRATRIPRPVTAAELRQHIDQLLAGS